MNSKQKKTLQKIFEIPTRPDIAWSDTESLLKACGADVREVRGSRVVAIKGKEILRLHRPHPQKELKRYAVENVRGFLEVIGFKPQAK